MKQFLTLGILGLLFQVQAQNALNFDGVNDYVEFTNAGPTGTTSRTVEAWIRTNNSISTQQVILDWGDMSIGNRFTMNMINFGKLRIEVGGNGFNSTTSIADGNWHHVAITYDNSAPNNFSMYIDGIFETSSNVTVSVNTSSVNGVLIGRRNDGVNYFQGDIDEVRIWDVVRTSTEISNNMNSEFCSVPPGLMFYLNFNQGTAGGSNSKVNTLDNATSQGNGTLKSFSLSGSTSNWVTGAPLSGGLSVKRITEFVCDSFVSPSNKFTWTTSGTYRDTLQNSNSCDSLMTFKLTIGKTVRDTTEDYGCGFYKTPLGNKVWTTSGTYYDTLMNGTGCSTFYTYILDVFQIDSTVTLQNKELTANELNGQYQWIDCDNGGAKIANANMRIFKPEKDGNYAVIIYKDSCIDTSACFEVTAVGIENLNTSQLNIYPNPASDKITISVGLEMQNVHILDQQGQLIREYSNLRSKMVIDVSDLASGVYIIKGVSEGSLIQKKIVKL